MQASILPIQISGAGAAPARPANGSSDGAQFSQTLSREMAQRQNTASTPAPAPAPNRSQAKPAAADRPAQANAQRAPDKAPEKGAERVSGKDAERTDEAQAGADADGTAAASAPASAAPARKGDGTESASEGGSVAGETAAAALDAATLGPMAEMLALVAGFNQPLAPPPASAAPASASNGLTAIAADAEGATAQRGAVIEPSTVAAGAAAIADAASGTQAGAAASAPAPGMAKLIAQASAAAGAGGTAAGAAAGTATDSSRIAASPAELAMAQARMRIQAEGAPMQPSPAMAVDGQASAPAQDTASVVPAEASPLGQDASQLGDLASGPGAAQPATAAVTDAKGSAPVQQPQALPVADADRRAEFRAPEPVQANLDLQVHSASTQPLSGPVQQLSAGLAQTMASAAADHIPARVGSTAWENQVGQKIVWMVAGEEQSASLTLNPPDLGPMQVVLSVTNDQASVSFTAAQPEVRQALEDALPKLREMMGESGISLGSASVNAGSPQQQAFAGADSGQGKRDGGARGDAGRSGNAETGPAANGRAGRPGGNGLVDTFA